ncbi:MAG: cytochrome P450 [Sphingomonadales bacterium]|nr:cytochrome P450 [Sphingomonadales bacterium]
MADYAESDFFMDLSLVDDPYPYFEYLRGAGPVVPLPAHGVIAVTGFDEALAVHLDHEHFSAVNSVTGPLPPIPFVPEGEDISAQIEAHRARMPFGEDVLTLDPPRHTPLRSLMMRLFTPRRLKEMETSITALADQLIDEIAARGTCELVRDYAKPFATLAIADLLGVPAADREQFRAILAVSASPSTIGAGDAPVVNPMDFRRDKFVAYVEERRASPQGDILGELAGATYADGTVPAVADVVRVATLLFGAGQDTTATLLGNALRLLAERPDLQAQLRAEPELIPDFLEELLRIGGPVKSTFRLAKKPVTLAGVAIPVGTTVMITTAAVNRDPSKFAAPAEFRMGRPGAKEHLAFGRGIHTCPGAALARTEARISLERMLAQLDAIRLDETEHGPAEDRRFAYLPTYVFRALKELHLTFTPSQSVKATA